MPYNFTEDALKSAVIKVDRYEMEALPADNEIDHEFSRDFERKMQKLIRKSNKSNTSRGGGSLAQTGGCFDCRNHHPVCVRNERTGCACFGY